MIRNLNDFWRGWVCAMQFLTRLPTPTLQNYQPQDSGHALALFPWVGLNIGALLALSALMLSHWLAPMPTAAVTVTLWALITGGLHLDGLGDSADGWLSGANKEKALQIMKDPRCGSAAVIAIGCLLLLKFALLTVVIEQQNWWVIVLSPMLGRTAALVLLLTTPYVSSEGIGEDFLRYSNRRQLIISVGLSVILLLIWLPLAHSVWVLLWLLMLFAGFRHLMVKRLEGCSGDTCGALIECAEVAVLMGTS